MSKRRARGEGSVFFKEEKSAWVFRAVVGRHPDGRIRYLEGQCRTQGEAIKLKRDAERVNKQADTELETVADYLRRWLADVKSTVRPSTWLAYDSKIRLHIIPIVGGIRIRQFKTQDVSRMFRKLTDNGETPGNCRKIAEILSCAMEAGVRDGTVATSPTRGAIKPKVIRPVIEVFTDEEVKSIIDAVKGKRNEALIYTAIGTGMRQGELFALEVGDID